MRIVEGRSYREIARELGCNEAACKMRLSRALRRLREDLRAAS
jgi:DNA-directed RNA polymerase specialized sigma24 family protein